MDRTPCKVEIEETMEMSKDYVIGNHFHNPYNECVIKSQKGHMY